MRVGEILYICTQFERIQKKIIMKHLHLNTRRIAQLLFLLLTVSDVIWAAPRTVEQAKQAALEQMRKYSAKRSKGQSNTFSIEPQLVFSKLKNNAKTEDAYYYVFSAGNNRGYTIISGDDRFPAIVGYTESGDYSTEKLPTNLVSFMQSYQDFMDNATDEQIAEIQAWRAQGVTHSSVVPFLEAKWNQSEPYNNMCPEYKYYMGENILTNRSVTGCVATAIAQILYHYRHPTQLMTTIPAYELKLIVNSYTNYIQMPEIAEGEMYDWDNMLPVYNGSESNTQNDAVAKLMLHAGCAVNMSYGPSSGSNASAETFTKYFGMDADLVRKVYRKDFQIAEWDGMLYEEMVARRPVFYDGQSTGGGHAFVIHGYESGLYYVNWGWGGFCDGYFDITILNPQNTSGAGASISDDGYSMGNGMIIGIQQDNGIKDDIVYPTIESIQELSFENYNINGSEISGTVNHIQFQYYTIKEVTYTGIGYIDDNNKIIPVSTSFSRIWTVDCPPGKYFLTGESSVPCSFQYEEGRTYKLIAIESKDQKNWVACYGADKTAITLKISDGEIYFDEKESELHATATLDEEYSGGYAGFSNSIDVTVINTGNAEYYDKVYVYVSTSSERPGGYTYATGITAPVDGSTVFNFAYTPQTAGTYNFWILDASSNEIGRSSIDFKENVAPKLSFVSITCDNASDDKFFIDHGNEERLKVNIVYDTEAKFIVEIKNDGGYYEGDFWIFYYNESAHTFSGTTQKLVFPANQTTQFYFTKEGKEGSATGLMIKSYNESIDIDPLKNEYDIYDKNGNLTGWYIVYENSNICYLAGYNKDEELAIEGSLDESNVKALNNKLAHNDVITTLDLSKATLNTQTQITTANPNTLIYLGTEASIGNPNNVVKNGVCENLALTDGYPFRAARSFTANEATYSRSLNSEDGWYSVCLPYVATIPDDVVVEKFKTVDPDNKTITFSLVETMEANTPYIFQTADEVVFEGTNVEVQETPEQIVDGSFVGTYKGFEAPTLQGYYILKADGSGFAIATDEAYATPFRAVINPNGLPNVSVLKLIHSKEDGSTIITDTHTDIENNDEYYTLQGIKVKKPSKGIYVKNGKKVVIK